MKDLDTIEHETPRKQNKLAKMNAVFASAFFAIGIMWGAFAVAGFASETGIIASGTTETAMANLTDTITTLMVSIIPIFVILGVMGGIMEKMTNLKW